MISLPAPPTMNPTDPYLAKFQRFEQDGVRQQPAWLLALRKTGMNRFAELGFPTTEQEDWRFTNVAPITKLPFEPVFNTSADGPAPEALSSFAFTRLKGSRLVFVNGLFSTKLSSITPQAAGIRIGSLADALVKDPALVEPHLARYAGVAEDAFAALNTAFFQDGALVYVPAGLAVDEPVQLLYLSTAEPAGLTIHPRNLIIVGAGGRLTVVEGYVRLADAPYLTNTVTEVFVGEGAHVEYCKFQDESPEAYHMATLHAHLGRGSNVVAHSFATGARLSRNNIRTKLDGEGLECVLNGLYLTRGDQLADHHMIVEHAQPHCASHEYFNGILDDRSKGVFHGRILVQRAAQKTDAKQTNKNLLLSDHATVDTKPQLEIYADDVKCTHGATIGQMNEESIFYLRARGIGLKTARRMLMHAFAGEIIDRVRCEPVREELNKLVWDRLEASPHIAETK